MKPQGRKVLLLALLLVGMIALQLLNPQFLRLFIDRATAGASNASLLQNALLFIAAALISQGFTIAARYVGEDVGWVATNALRADLVAHCMGLDLSFHKARTPGELIERIDGDVNNLAIFFSQFAIDLGSNLVLLIGVLALLYREDWRVGLGMSLFALFGLAVLAAVRNLAVPFWGRLRESVAQFYGLLGEVLGGTETLQASGATGYAMNRIYRHLRSWREAQRRIGLVAFTPWMATILVFAVGNGLSFALGAWLYRAGAITLGTVFLIFNYTELLRRPIEQIRTQMQELQKASASIARVEELFAVQTRLPDGQGADLPQGALSVTFDDVTFAYEVDEESVLHGIGFHLAPGSILGLLGRTGSGKSTLARLAVRLYDASAGAVSLGGVSVRQPRLAQLRRRVGVVTQDVQLFAASVRDNLTFFDPTVADEAMLGVLAELGLGEWLKALPAGLDTMLAAEGGLSAGEAQLLALGRVFLQDPGLVILDEASSRLDPATERLVEKAVGRLLAGRTAIIIAHRLATVERADQIMILDGGRIVEHGERGQLAGEPESRFAHLLRTGMEEVLS